MGARALACAVQAVRDSLQQHVVDERRLAGARDAGDGGQRPQRDAHVDPAQVVLAGAADLDVAARRAAAGGNGDLRRAGQELAGQRLGHELDLERGPFGDDVAAVLTSPRPEVDDVVGCAHRLLVVLDDQNGVAEVA